MIFKHKYFPKINSGDSALTLNFNEIAVTMPHQLNNIQQWASNWKTALLYRTF